MLRVSALLAMASAARATGMCTADEVTALAEIGAHCAGTTGAAATACATPYMHGLTSGCLSCMHVAGETSNDVVPADCVEGSMWQCSCSDMDTLNAATCAHDDGVCIASILDEVSDPCELCALEFGDDGEQLCNGCGGSSGASTATIGAILAADVAAAASPTGEQQDQPLVSDDTIARSRLSFSAAIFPYLSRPPARPPARLDALSWPSPWR